MSTQPLQINAREVPPPANPDDSPDRTPPHPVPQPGQPVVDPEYPKSRHEKPHPDVPRTPQDLPGQKLQ